VTSTSTHPAQRDCALYEIYVLDPRTNYTTITRGYIGETAREPFVRFLEHLYEKDFADTIVGPPRVVAAFNSKAEVLAAEEAAVRTKRPLYNIEYNMDNPQRIPPWTAREQRAARDAARATEGAAPAPAPVASPRARRPRSRPPARPSRTARPAPPRVRPLRWRHRRVWLALLWLAVAAALCWTVIDRVGARDAVGLGAAGAAALFVAAVGTRRRRR
jgi:hypothetical protein